MSMHVVDWRKEHTVEGMFFLADSPEQKVSGTLQLKAGSFPQLSTIARLLPEGSTRVAQILGVTYDGDVSLLGGALQFSDTIPHAHFSRQRIIFDVAVLGSHTTADRFAKRLLLRFTNTHGLASGRRAWSEERYSAGTGEDTGRRINLHRRETIAATQAGEVSVAISVDPQAKTSLTSRGDEFTIRPETEVRIEFPEPVSYSHARELWDDLRLLWSVLTGNKSDLVAGWLTNGDESSSDRISLKPGMVPFVGVASREAENEDNFGDFFYDLTDGRQAGALSSVLSKWIESRNTLRLSADLLVNTWGRYVSWESKLGIIAQGLEAFHRTSPYQQTFVESDEYRGVEQKIAKEISAATSDSDLRTSLRKRIEFGNQVSLRRRTKDLIRNMPPGLRDAFGKWQALADHMVLARNAIIHRDPASPPPSFRETIRIVGHFQLTLHVAILQALGVDDDLISLRLQMQQPYQTWLRYLKPDAE